MWLSAVQQHEPAVCVCVCVYTPPLQATAEHQAELPVLHVKFSLAVYLRVVAQMQKCSSLNSSRPLLLHLCVIHKSLLHICVSIPALQISHSLLLFDSSATIFSSETDNSKMYGLLDPYLQL